MSCFNSVCNNVSLNSDSVHSSMFDQKSSFCKSSPFPSQSNLVESDLWHRRLGHPSVKVLSSVHTNLKSIKGLSFCSACKYGKMHQDHFSLSQTKTSKPFELVYSDVWGPSHTCSLTGYKY